MIWAQIIGSILSLIGVWLATRRRVASFPVALAACLVYCGIFSEAKLYSDALLQLVFAAFIVYGWYYWRRNLGKDQRVRVARLPRSRALVHVLLGVAGALLLGALMRFGTNAALPWLDAALASFSLVGQWWQDRRHTAAWWLWIVIDVLYIGEYIYKDLHITAVLYAVFVGLAVVGLRSWQVAARRESGPHSTDPSTTG